MDGDLLAVGIDHEDRIGDALHVANAVEVGLELSELLLQQDLLLLGELLHATISLHSFELFHALNT